MSGDAITVPCPSCKAKAGIPCDTKRHWPDGPSGVNRMDEVEACFHVVRQERADLVWGRTRDSASAVENVSAKPQLVKIEGVEAVKAALESIPLPSVCRWVHYYGKLPRVVDARVFGAGLMEFGDQPDSGPFAALVVDVGPGPTTVTLKIFDRQGRDHVRANVEYGDPGWMWPPRVG